MCLTLHSNTIMKPWHIVIFLALLLAAWSFNKTYVMTGGKEFGPSPEMFIISLLLAGVGIAMKTRKPNSSREDILDEDEIRNSRKDKLY